MYLVYTVHFHMLCVTLQINVYLLLKVEIWKGAKQISHHQTAIVAKTSAGSG